VNTAAPLQLRVRAITFEAEGVLGCELTALDPSAALPAFAAGAHIDLHLPGAMVRSYSLLNDPRETHRYCIGVHLARARAAARAMCTRRCARARCWP
jgi:ferredoxin-NADP reductase